jgi:predicted O-linked N-acetylglucosamine transferase (SPINDLY family)
MAAMAQISIGDLFRAAETLEKAGDGAGAIDLYKKWIAYNPGDANLHAAMFNYAVVMARFGDAAGAINVLRDCIRLKPDFLQPYINLGRLLEDSGLAGNAIGQWFDLVKRMPELNGENLRHKLMALQQAGRVLETHHLDIAAEDVLRQSLDLKPDQPEVVQHWVALRQKQCKWPVITPWEGVTKQMLVGQISPLTAAVIYDDPVFQVARSWHYAKDLIKLPSKVYGAFAQRQQPRPQRLKIGYVSSDLREHAVGFGLSEALELHDKSRFEIHAFYCGIANDDATKQRIKGSVEHWTDIRSMDDDAAAALIHEAEIDILIDLNGYTRDARTPVFARKPAPIQVNWYGFPGTMGTPYHHYIIGDDTVIPPGDEVFFTERVLRIPVYQPNDRKRKVANEAPLKTAENLPENGFVFCCLNGAQKITEPMFVAWMEILRGVPNSVLWLLDTSIETNERLRVMAGQHGVEGHRICFAPKRPNAVHLARYQLADLFLDTFPYGAHTTASDAMWMGTPVLTMPGESFASRVCGSLVRSAGMPELITHSIQDYVAEAIRLGTNPAEASMLKEKLLANRDSSILFDTAKLVSSLEGAYDTMWDEFAAGQLPRPDLRNLDAYEQVAIDLNTKDGAYDANAYRLGLSAIDALYPLTPDNRLWPSARDGAEAAAKTIEGAGPSDSAQTSQRKVA